MREILDDLADYLEFEIEEGRGTLELMPDKFKDRSEPHPVKEPEESNQEKPARIQTPDSESPEARLEKIAGQVSVCTKCVLHQTRNKTVPGQGSVSPEIMFVGEAPGFDEDRQGLAFVGRAGKLLTKMIEAMGYTRDEVFIGNIIKCRPPDNRKPMADEMETCMPYLSEQISILQPKVIIALGATAVQGLFQTKTGISKLRGQWMSFEDIDVMPTYHPAYLLRNPAAKKDVWEDLQEVLRHLGRPVPVRERQG